MLKTLLTAAITLAAAASLQAEQTLSIIKPDAVKARHIGDIISRFEKNGLDITQMKMVRLSKDQAEQFYAEHKSRPFYPNLVEYMTSGPVVVMVLDGNNAINKNRILMGATDPKKAAAGTLRNDFGTSIEHNAVHGSDSTESAEREITFFFSKN